MIAVYLLRWLYQRSTKETAFVRTGFGGEKVVVSGGAFVIPVLHDITPVNMTVMRIEVERRETQALITKNRMRVDVIAEFFVKVGSSREAVGRRRADARPPHAGARRRARSAGRPVRLGAAHRRRADDARADARAAAGLCRSGSRPSRWRVCAQNGLDLESVAIVDLDQTNLEFFDSSNAFDAEGLTQLTETIESRRRMRNEIEQRTQIEIRTQNLDAQRKALDIDREGEYARLAQEQDIELRRTAQRLQLATRPRAARPGKRTGAAGGARGGREVEIRPGAQLSPRRASATRRRSSSARSRAAA